MNLNFTHNLKSLQFMILYYTNNLFGLGKYIPAEQGILNVDLAQYADYVLTFDNHNELITDIGDLSNVIFDVQHGVLTAGKDNDFAGALYRSLIESPNNWWVKTIEEEDAKTMNRTLNLFGLPLLEWDLYAIKEANGQWVYMHKYNDDNNKKILNGFRKESLMKKGKTVLILGVAFYGVWYGYKKYIKRR
jgi:hypothetical protein